MVTTPDVIDMRQEFGGGRDYELQEQRVCRNCHDTAGDDFIAPCSCAGSMKWVHRSCLDQWRAASPNSMSFYVCDVCKTHYKLRQRSNIRCQAYTRFVLYCVCDVAVVVGLIGLVMMILGFVMYGIDCACDFTSIIFPEDWVPKIQQMWAEVWLYGPALLLFIVGIVGSVLLLKNCLRRGGETSSATAHVTYDTYPNYHATAFPGFWLWYVMWNPYYFYPTPVCYCPGCNCAGCDCHSGGNCSGCNVNSGGDAGKILLIILLIIIAIIIVIGFFIGMALLVLLFSFLFRNHFHQMLKKEQAAVLEVIDLATADDATLASAVTVDLETGSAAPSAPLMGGK
eukprot:TRINITY_DN5108_c0_g2_i1.p1 TRINITY_DN5108_c0_g2~~TRINITY_DN5108_c0_g2_i1.p1  ORF type:complete len:340 (-),score=72.13 TRINITY_DN5108_c0_g2_i1:403-1422(-)